MAQKSNPISLRLKKTNKLWSSSWYGDYNYTTQLLQDCQVHAHVQNICQQAKIAPPVVFINRGRRQMRTFFYFPNPRGVAPRQQRMPKMRIKRAKHYIFPTLPRAQENNNWFSNMFLNKVPCLFLGGGHPTCKETENAQALGGEEPSPASFHPVNSPGEKQEKGFPYWNGQEKVFSYLLLYLFTPLTLGTGAARGKQIKKDFTFLSSTLDHLLRFTSEYNHWIYPVFTAALRQEEILLLKRDYQRVDANHMGKSPAPAAGAAGAPAFPDVLLKKKGQSWPLSALFSGFMGRDSLPGKGLSRPSDRREESALASLTSLESAGMGMIPFPLLGAMPKAKHMSNIIIEGHNNWKGGTGKKAAINHTAVPGVATPWKNHLENSIYASARYRCKFYFLLCPSPHQNPLFLATQVVFSLQDRMPFRRLKHRLMRDISEDRAIKGVRITCSGRVAARSKKAQKAKTESIQWGQTSLNVFSDFVHFASKSALTPFGKIGVKVWICYR